MNKYELIYNIKKINSINRLKNYNGVFIFNKTKNDIILDFGYQVKTFYMTMFFIRFFIKKHEIKILITHQSIEDEIDIKYLNKHKFIIYSIDHTFNAYREYISRNVKNVYDVIYDLIINLNYKGMNK